MIDLSRAHQEHIRDILKSTSFARDALPYTAEFGRLKEEFYNRTFRKLTDEEFWTACVNVAKQGGVRGKQKCGDAPELSEKEMGELVRMLPVPLGQRDRLPYTTGFTKLVARFNAFGGKTLSEREIWLAILNAAK
jgi:hypothetical protein